MKGEREVVQDDGKEGDEKGRGRERERKEREARNNEK
jgi:hypothetical protein